MRIRVIKLNNSKDIFNSRLHTMEMKISKLKVKMEKYTQNEVPDYYKVDLTGMDSYSSKWAIRYAYEKQ